VLQQGDLPSQVGFGRFIAKSRAALQVAKLLQSRVEQVEVVRIDAVGVEVRDSLVPHSGISTAMLSPTLSREPSMMKNEERRPRETGVNHRKSHV
jgi:hypothetical protein